METRSGIHSLVASTATSIVIVLIFYILAAGKVSSNPEIQYLSGQGSLKKS